MPATTILNDENVLRIYDDSVLSEDELNTHTGYLVDGITIHNVLFHPARIGSHRLEIEDMLRQLDRKFHDVVVGKHSFTEIRQNGDEFWTEDYVVGEKLVLLGIGIGRIRPFSSYERELWPTRSFHGGVPYIKVRGLITV